MIITKSNFGVFLGALCGGLLLVSSGASAAGFAVDVDASGLALKGHDPVAYFTDQRPTLGSTKYTARVDDVEYRFATSENRERFLSDPDKFRPAYGGYCAYGITLRVKVTGDPNAWKIVDGVLYINSSLKSLGLWSEDIPGYIGAANKIWPEIRDIDPELL